MATLSQILEETKRMVATKQAEISGTPPSSLPGAEHDSAVPAQHKQPDPETRDGTMVPTSGLSASGAGDDSEITRGHALESDEAALTPEKKPELTADANAKTAADLANEILALVHSVQKKAAAPAQKAVPEKAVPEKAVPEKTAEAEKEAKCAGGKKPVKKAVPEKTAGELNMELTTDVMAKIAAIVLSTEEGAAMTEAILTKQAGAAMANETLDFLAEQSELAERQAAYDAGVKDAEAAYIADIYNQGIEDGRRNAVAMFKRGQAAVDEVMSGAGGGEKIAPEALAAGDQVGEEDITEEDVVEALNLLVAEGTLKPEEAEKVMAQLAGGAEGAAAAGMEAQAQAAESPEAPGGVEDVEISPDEVIEVLQELVQDGTLQPEEAEQVLEQVVNGAVGGAESDAMPEADTAAAGGELDDGGEAAKTAAVNELLIDAVNRLRRK